MANEIEESRFVNTERVSPHLTAIIVRGYVRHHRLGPDQLPDLIASVHRTLGQLGQQVQPAEVLTPAVPVRRSVHRDYVICLDCGYRGKTLRRHISSRHGLTGMNTGSGGACGTIILSRPPRIPSNAPLWRKSSAWAENLRRWWRRQRNLLRQKSRSKSRRAPSRRGLVAPDQSPM